MKFGTIVFLLSVFVLTQSVVGHRAKSTCQRNNMILQRRVASLFHRNKELMCMVENSKPKECSPLCGELEVCTTGGTCECGDTTVRDGRGNCVSATPIECTPACRELEVCTTGGTCECDSSSIRDTNGSCVPAAPIECTPACGEREVCTTGGTCECDSSSIRDTNGSCVPAAPIQCTPPCGEGEVCTTGGTCECDSSSIRDTNGSCVPAAPIECTPACGEREVCTTGGTCECDSSAIRDTNGSCVPAAPIECTPACGEGEVCTTEGKCECGSSLARDGSGNCVPTTTGYCGPTCLTSTCTNCDSDIISGEMTLNLATGEILGNLPGATVELMALTTNPDGANVDCKYKSRVKVTFEPEMATVCGNLLRIQMTFGANRSMAGFLFHFGDSITNNITGPEDMPDTQSHNAEMFGLYGDVFFQESKHGGLCDGELFEAFYGVLGLNTNTTLATVQLAHRYSRVQINGDEFDKEVCDECLFELNDAVDNVAPDSNRDLYLAFNRAVNSDEPEYDGYGVCSAKLSWVCNVANP